MHPTPRRQGNPLTWTKGNPDRLDQKPVIAASLALLLCSTTKIRLLPFHNPQQGPVFTTSDFQRTQIGIIELFEKSARIPSRQGNGVCRKGIKMIAVCKRTALSLPSGQHKRCEKSRRRYARRETFHHRSIDQLRQGKDLIPLFLQAGNDPPRFLEPLPDPFSALRRDVVQHDDVAGADLLQDGLREPRNPPVSPVKSAATEGTCRAPSRPPAAGDW
jgi:hypothetical protein